MPNSDSNLVLLRRAFLRAGVTALMGTATFSLSSRRLPSCCMRRGCSQVDTGNVLEPGEILVEGERIREVGKSVEHPASARTIDLGDVTLMPGLIDAHVHLFLHPGAEDLQTVEESVPWRMILAEQAAKADLMAGFTAERDMGTEGAGSADTAIRDAINQGLIPGPRLRISGNAIDILGGHEDANRYNPAQHVLSNADYANSAEQTRRGDARAAQGGLGLRQDLRDRAGQDDRRRPALRPTNTPPRNSPPRSTRPIAWAPSSPCTPWASRARCTRRRRASRPSTTPRSSATRPCA